MVRKILCLSVFLIVPFAAADDSPELKALKKNMPADVVPVLERTVECNRWRGEEPTNKERAEKVNKALEKWACSTLEKDQQALTIRYQNDYQVKARIQEANYIL